MKILYLDCGMGAAGDMLTAALYELLPDKEDFLDELNSLGIPGVTVFSEASAKCGIQGTYITVKVNDEEEREEIYSHDHEYEHSHSHKHTHDHEHFYEHKQSHDGEYIHHHSSMHDIEHIIERLPISERVKAHIFAVYSLIAEAESHVHSVPVTEIHFHEVGTMDAIADITAVCMLMDRLSPEQVIVSPIHVGSG
ncbi:MAG: LarC family nickel insertion protein, partial [Clostridiales bacterium]|nr:LarC family nickel insertion protein [Clostridiales bacterium]